MLRRMSRKPFSFALLLACVIASTASSEARTPPTFDLEAITDGCQYIVRGKILPDGSVMLRDALKGEMESFNQREILLPSADVKALKAIETEAGDWEAVCFFRAPQTDLKQLEPSASKTAYLSPTGFVFAHLPSNTISGSDLRPHEVWTVESFEDIVRQSVSRHDELDRLLTLPRSPDRAVSLVAFLQAYMKEARPEKRTGDPATFFGVIASLKKCPTDSCFPQQRRRLRSAGN